MDATGREVEGGFQSAPDGEVGGDAPGLWDGSGQWQFQSAPDGEVGGDGWRGHRWSLWG